MSDSKQIIFDNFASQYQAISSTIKSLPIPAPILSIILQNFDTGFLWVKEAFQVINFDEQKESPKLDENIEDVKLN